MPDKQDSLNEKLLELRKSYISSLPERLTTIARSAARLLDRWDRAEADILHRASHSLAGSGATYGLQGVSILAKHLEKLLQEIQHRNTAPEMHELEQIHSYIEGIKSAIEHTVIEHEAPDSPTESTNTHPRSGHTHRKRILLVDDDEHQTRQLDTLLTRADYEVICRTSLDGLYETIAREKPDALILDVIFPESGLAGIEAYQEIKDKLPYTIPILFISQRNDIEARLAAVHAGADHYFCKPVDSYKLISALKACTEIKRNDIFTIAIIDDDVDVADYHAQILKNAGMKVSIINDPLQSLEQLAEIQPDLILMDVYMPGCDGVELACVLRQERFMRGIPVIYLSGETDLKKQIAAMQKGGDDFVTKPVDPDYLVSIVHTRAKQAYRDIRIADQLHRTLRENQAQKLAMDQHAIISIADNKGLIVSVNNKFCEISRYSRQELIGENHRILNSGYHPREFFQEMWQTISSGKVWQGEIRNRRKDGSFYWVESTIMPLLDDTGKPYQYVSIRTDITSIKEAEIQAEKANRAKSDFLSSMSHELRTPLNAILGFAQLLEFDLEAELSENQRENINHILKSGWHLLELINEVLDLSKIETGKLTLSLEKVCLQDVIGECIGLIEPLAQARGISIVNKIPSKPELRIRADRTRLKQVVLNLMSNAVKYNRDRGTIYLSTEQTPDNMIKTLVQDTGTGISQDHMHRLFQPFERLGNDGSQIEGTGIGLVITKRLIELMDGNIGATSKPGKGSTFWFELHSHQSNGDTLQFQSGILNHQENDSQAIQEKKLVLYVEDNPANLKLVQQLIDRRSNLAMISAHNAELGIDLARGHKPDLIILDINLPGMDGYDALKRLRSHDETLHTPVVALSANAMPRDIERGLREGFAEYLTKPIDVQAFYDAVDKVLP